MEDFLELMEEMAGEFGESLRDGDERFTVDTDEKAEWVLRKIAEEDAECDRLTAVCDAEIERYRARKEGYAQRRDRRTGYLRGLLEAYFGTIAPKETKTQLKYELPGGSLVLKKPSREYKVDGDGENLRDWLMESGLTEYLKMEVTPRWAQVKKQLSTASDGRIVFGETGEIVPMGCVYVEEKPARFDVKCRTQNAE